MDLRDTFNSGLALYNQYLSNEEAKRRAKQDTRPLSISPTPQAAGPSTGLIFGALGIGLVVLLLARKAA